MAWHVIVPLESRVLHRSVRHYAYWVSEVILYTWYIFCIRGLAALAGVWLSPAEMGIGAALWACVIWEGLLHMCLQSASVTDGCHIPSIIWLNDGVLAWLSVWSVVQMICMCSSWCLCYPIISCFSIIQNDLPFWCRLTQVDLEKKSVKCMCVCVLSRVCRRT